MRVLMTADTVGGVWQYAVQLASALSDREAFVLLATMGPEPTTAQRAEAAAVPGLKLRTSTFALEWMPAAWDGVDAASVWLRQLEDEFGPDVIHLNGYTHASLPWRAPTLVVAHSCVCSWWQAVHGTMPPPEWDEYVSRVAAGLQAATAIAAPTQAMATELARSYRVKRDVCVIANARPATNYSPKLKESFVLSAGRLWDKAKNLAALNTAARDLEWPVYVAGDVQGPSGEGNSLPHVRELGRIKESELADWMGRAAIYALPARYEPFGLSVLEAALSGCALVLGDIPSLRENWTGVAHFVHPDRPEELRNALRLLINNPAMRAEMGAAARRRGECFSVVTHADAYERLYREMVTTHGRIAHSAWTL